MRSITPCAIAVSLTGLWTSTTFGATLEVWPVDPLIKVFPDAAPNKVEPPTADVARGEHASLQVVVRCDAFARGLKAEVGKLALEGRPAGGSGELNPRPPRFVGYVPVDVGISDPPKDRLRTPPAWFPDPLLEQPTMNLTPGSAQAVWVTIPVPTGATPGSYRGELRLSTHAGRQALSATLPLTVRVWPVTVDKCRLWVTNWFQVGEFPESAGAGSDAPGKKALIEQDSARYWELLERYARNMADHRQNVAMISPLRLAGYRPRPDGTLEIDFTRFDRWVKIFTDAGVIGRIEGGHIGRRAGGWNTPFLVSIYREKDGKVDGENIDPTSPAADAFYAQFFPALTRHLKEQGWLDHYLQHLADEPNRNNAASYRALSSLAKKYAPELRVIEASATGSLGGAIQVWVPRLEAFHREYAYYQERRAAGEEVWFYTCMGPQGEYANRFIEQPLIKTRLLHWINFRYGAAGYLHWSYNAWPGPDPWRQLAIPRGNDSPHLPAGDGAIVYPGKDGPLDSIRFEAMRDGIVDHELLSRLAEQDPAAARRLAETFVLDFDKYNTDVAQFRAARHMLLQRLSAAATKPHN